MLSKDSIIAKCLIWNLTTPVVWITEPVCYLRISDATGNQLLDINVERFNRVDLSCKSESGYRGKLGVLRKMSI